MRNQGGRSWRIKLVLFVSAGTATGAVVGALMGALGSLVEPSVREVVAISAAGAGLALAVVGVLGLRVPLLQHDVATPQRWMHQGPVRWATKNGAALGFGASSRIGFALWYVVPLSGLLTGNVALGVVVWALYALIRTSSAWPMIRVQRRADGLRLMDRLAIDGRSRSVQSTSILLAVLCLTTIASMGT